MEQKLSSEERKYLVGKHRKEKNGKVRDRIKAVLAYDDGYTYSEIAKLLLLDDETIRRHIRDYVKRQKLRPSNGGSPSQLDKQQTQKLIAHLEEKTYLYVKEICVYVNITFGIDYTVSGMTKWLRQNKFSYKKPQGTPAKADLARQKAFIEKYNELKNTLKADEILLFGDSTHPQHQTRLAYGWIRKGKRKPEKMTACQKRINLIGALELATHHIEYRQVDWVNVDSLKDFVNQLEQAYPLASTIHLILDNAGYHKGAKFLEFIETTKIKLHYLPPYSPNLNPIERLWKIMHEQVTYNHYYRTFSDFTEKILGFFKNIDDYSDIIQSRINDNFQRLELA